MRIKSTLSIIIILFTLFIEFSYSQIPSVPIPQLRINNIQVKNSPINNFNYPNVPNNGFNQQAQQEAILREVQAHQLQQQEIVKNKLQNKEQAEKQRQYDIMMLAQYGFPMQSDSEGTSAFYSAFDEINNMLSGHETLNLGRAIFLVENAWHNNKYNYEAYHNSIKLSVDFCNQKIEEEQLDKNDKLVKNMMLFRYITDTLNIEDKHTHQKLTHYPVKYNYEDYESKISYDSHFVTTLMQNGTGQCHSMPLYYLILAEEIGTDAYWSFSPLHSFVKIQDRIGNWHNLELTCKAILSDSHYMNSSYIKAEALQNKIYLEPMDKVNIVAEMMVDLARGYYQKYGYDDFYLKCINTAQQYLKNDLNVKILKSAYQTQLTLTLAHLLNASKPEMMQELSPESYKHYELMQSQYKEIDNMGYEELPVSIYAMWLDHIAKEKQKADRIQRPSIMFRKDQNRQ